MNISHLQIRMRGNFGQLCGCRRKLPRMIKGTMIMAIDFFIVSCYTSM